MAWFLFRRCYWLVACCLATAGWPLWVQAQTSTVAAASDLRFALPELAAAFEQQTGAKLSLVFGSSGNFFAQIQQKAPFHVFMSADEEWVYKLADAGLTVDRGRAYALGRLGILVPIGSALKADGSLRDLALAIQDGRLRKLAIANPEHAPYGARAQEALQHAGLWDALQGKLVYAENISQAAQFATAGAAQAGLVAQSLYTAPAVAATGDFALVPESWHKPLKQRMVLLKGAPPQAQAFYHFVATPAAQGILQRYGFVMPKE